MSKLIQAIEDATNVAYTANAAPSLKTTKSDVLDFFALGGAMRNRPEQDIQKAFSLAYAENKLLALKATAYLRDIRGGQGERRTFRTILKFLGENYPNVAKKNLDAFVEYGRWDDLFSFFGTDVEKDVLTAIKKQLSKDIKSKDSISLLAKWLPSENTSSKETRARAAKVRKFLGLSSKEYRQTLSNLRARLAIVERSMCSNEWGNINYENVPSRAALIYRKAFGKHDQERYKNYIEDVQSGKKEIKASTLFPYDIVNQLVDSGWQFLSKEDPTLDAQWKALPDYCKDNPSPRGLVVCDVSGSMFGGNNVRPITVSISLAIYFAERNKGIFKNTYISFSGAPELIKIKGDTICQKVRHISTTNVGYITNIQAVFDLLLKTANDNSLSQKDLPDVIYIISDMQFDTPSIGGRDTNFEAIKKKYKASGYKMPKLVFWNVNAFNQEVPVKAHQSGTALVSGCSPVVFKTVMSGNTPYQVMMETLNQERYDLLKV